MTTHIYENLAVLLRTRVPTRQLPCWFSKLFYEHPASGNALLYISLLAVAFGRVRPIQWRTLFLLCFIVFCAQHPVSDTNMGLDRMRRIRVSFQFLRRDAM